MLLTIPLPQEQQEDEEEMLKFAAFENFKCARSDLSTAASDIVINHQQAESGGFDRIRLHSDCSALPLCSNQAVQERFSLGTYILYLEPSRRSHTSHALESVRTYLESVFGYDESSQYPIHCTLTSFFDVEPRTFLSPKHHIQYAQAVRKGLADALSSLQARLIPSHQDNQVVNTIYEGSDAATPAPLAASTATSLDQEELFSSGERQGYDYEIRRGPVFGREATPVSDYRFVHPCPDGSIIAPLDLSFLTKGEEFKGLSMLDYLCAEIRTRVQAYLDIPVEIKSTRKRAEQIFEEAPRPKPSAHITLLGQKQRTLPMPREAIIKAARMFERAASEQALSISWDLRIKEVIQWGKKNNQDCESHIFRTIAEIPSIARYDFTDKTTHQTATHTSHLSINQPTFPHPK